ncbi:hypothetical protein C8J32_10641 [Rhizobium sp. PP-CC-3A-592]|nr:hypothetical protein C8J32_10641 [Rhizobium sp. PP-CC-3A-592]
MVRSPRAEATGPDRNLACQEQLYVPVRALSDQAVTAGWTTPEVFDALEEVIRKCRLSYAEDPDPADASSEISIVSGFDGATANL